MGQHLIPDLNPELIFDLTVNLNQNAVSNQNPQLINQLNLNIADNLIPNLVVDLLHVWLPAIDKFASLIPRSISDLLPN
jgi:hypothetical protein